MFVCLIVGCPSSLFSLVYRFIVQVAHELGGIIVSTDNYRDLIAENNAWRETIEKRY